MSCAIRIVIVALAVCAGPVVAADPLRLNGTLVLGGNATGEFQFDADGSRIVYLADEEVDGVLELISAPSAGGAAAKISGTMTAGGTIVSGTTRPTPNGNQWLYLADQDTNERFELYRTATSGGPSSKINGTLISNGDVDPMFRIGSDSVRVLYIADAQTDSVWELYSASLAGGTPTKLNGTLPGGGDVVFGSQQFSPNATRAFYVADQAAGDQNELFSVASSGGTAVKISGAMVPSGDVDSRYVISADGSRAVYVANATVDDNGLSVFEVFSVPANGGAAVKLNNAMTNGGDVVAGSLQAAPAGNRVIYLADAEADEKVELFGSPNNSSAQVKLSDVISDDQDVSSTGLQFSPDGLRVVFGVVRAFDGQAEIFSVPAAGGTAVKLNGSLGDFGSVDLASVAVSPTSDRVIYLADQNTDEAVELFSVPTAGGSTVTLNSPLAIGGVVKEARFSPDGSRVVYLADQDEYGVFQLYRVASAGGTPVRVNGPLVDGGDVTDWQFSPDGSSVVYRADGDLDDVFEIYSATMDAAADLMGDFNGDLVVDALDYTVWRNGLSSGLYRDDQFDMWKQHYGDRSGPGSGGTAELVAVPEPVAVASWMIAVALGMLVPRRARTA